VGTRARRRHRPGLHRDFQRCTALRRLPCPCPQAGLGSTPESRDTTVLPGGGSETVASGSSVMRWARGETSLLRWDPPRQAAGRSLDWYSRLRSGGMQRRSDIAALHREHNGIESKRANLRKP
jgi:hypothetical protein